MRDGGFDLPCIASVHVFDIYAEASGYAPRVELALRSTDDLDVVLHPARTLRGTVQSEQREPIAGATVMTQTLVAGAWVTRRAKTASDGTYMLRDLPRADVSSREWIYERMAVRHEQFAPYLAMGGVVEPSPQETRPTIVLSRGVTIEGTVRWASTHPRAGEPVPEATIVARAGNNAIGTLQVGARRFADRAGRTATIAETRSDREGRFTLPNMPLTGPPTKIGRAWGMNEVVAWAPGACAQTIAVAGIARDATPGESATINVRLHGASEVSGQLVDQNGEPLSDVAVFVARSPTFKGAGIAYVDGYNPPSEYAKSSDDGTFLIRGVAVGHETRRVQVHARRARSGGTHQESILASDVDVRLGERVDLGRLRMDTNASPGYAIVTRLRVQDNIGRPIAGARIGSTLGIRFGLVTSHEGTAEIHWRGAGPTGTQTRLVQAPGFATTWITFDPSGVEPVVVTLDPDVPIEGTVRAADGTPLAGAEVLAVPAAYDPTATFQHCLRDVHARHGFRGLIRGANGTSKVNRIAARVRTLADGSYVIRGIGRNGAHLCVLWSPVGYGGAASADAIRHEIRKLDAGTAIRTGFTIKTPPLGELVVIDVRHARTKTRIDHGQVWLSRMGTTIPSKRDAQLRATFGQVPIGRYQLHVKAKGFRLHSQEVEVQSGRAATIEPIHLEPMHRIVVRVVSREDIDVSRYWVTAQPASSNGAAIRNNTIRPGGALRIDDLEPGWYWLSMYAHGSQVSTPPLLAATNPVASSPATSGQTHHHADALSELTFVPAGTLKTYLQHPKLPPKTWLAAATSVDKDKRAFGGQTLLELLDSTDAVLIRRRGAHQGEAPVLGRIALPEGRYTVRVTFPGSPPVQKSAVVTANEVTDITIKAGW